MKNEISKSAGGGHIPYLGVSDENTDSAQKIPRAAIRIKLETNL